MLDREHPRQRRAWLAAIALAGSAWVAGCDDARTSVVAPEAGVLRFDAAMLAWDAGAPGDDGGAPGDDAGGRSDGAMPGLDAGSDGGTDAGPPLVCSRPDPIGGDCVLRVPVGSFGPLNSACLPRCSAATATAYRACTNQSCRNAALDADRTPGTMYFIGSVHVTTPMDCVACVSYQEFHCFSLVCRSQVDAYVDNCIVGVRPELCDSNIAAIDVCLASLSATQQATLAACMESAAGPPGCFACE